MEPTSLGPWLAVVLVVSGCAPRPELPVPDSAEVAEERTRQYADASEQMIRYWSRATDVTSRVRIAGAELCGEKVRAALGIVALSSEDLPRGFGRQGFWREFTSVFARTLELGDQVRVLHVVPRGPADVAGVAVGDIVVALDGRMVRDAEHLATLQSEDLGETFELRVRRSGGVERALRVQGLPECWYGLSISVTHFPNAYADGRTMYVTTGLLRFVESDDELALVVGHELAHNLLAHATASFKRSEQEADYLGCYFAARAGYDIRGAAAYWGRLAREIPAVVSENASYAHSGTATRAAGLARTVDEIQRKLEAGAPLVPNASP